MERGVSKVIGGDPKGNNFLYTNGKCVIIRNIDVIILKIILKFLQHGFANSLYPPFTFIVLVQLLATNLNKKLYCFPALPLLKM